MIENIQTNLHEGLLTFTYKGEIFQIEAESDDLFYIADLRPEKRTIKEANLKKLASELKESDQLKNAREQFKKVLKKETRH